MKKILLGGLIYLLFAGSAFSAEQWRVKLEEAKVNIDQGQYQNAETILQGLAKDHSDQLDVNYYLGLSQMAQGKYADAEKSFRAAAKVGPDDTLTSLDLAYALIAQNQPQEAGQLVDKVLAKDPKNGRANYLKGLVLVQQNNCKDAEAYLSSAKSQSQKNNAEISYYQGLCSKAAGKNQAAEKYFNESISTGVGSVWSKMATEQKAELRAAGTSKKKFSAEGDLFYQYDSNIVAVPDSNYLPSEISHMSDSRTVIWLEAGYRPILNSKSELGVEYHFYNNWHYNESDMDLQIHQGQVYGLYNFNLADMPARIYAAYLYQWAGLGTKYGYYGQINRVNPVFYLAESNSLVTEISYYFEDEVYDNPGVGIDDRNNTSNQIMAGQHFLFDGGKFDVALFGRYQNEEARGDNWDNNCYGGRILAQMKEWNKLSGWFYFDYDYRDYENNVDDRRDSIYQVGMEVQYKLMKYLAVFGGINYSDHNSTVESYDYSRQIYSVGIRGIY